MGAFIYVAVIIRKVEHPRISQYSFYIKPELNLFNQTKYYAFKLVTLNRELDHSSMKVCKIF